MTFVAGPPQLDSSARPSRDATKNRIVPRLPTTELLSIFPAGVTIEVFMIPPHPAPAPKFSALANARLTTLSLFY